MKRTLFFLISFFTSVILFGQNNEFELKITFKPFKNQYVYLGYHYGKQKPIVDSVLLDNNSVGVIKREKKIEKGIYLIGFPDKTGYFELLIDKEQKFAVSADTANMLFSIKFEGSPDNDLFLDYQKFTSSRGWEIEGLKTKLASAKSAQDSSKIRVVIDSLNKAILKNRLEIIEKNPNATITALLNAMRDPVIPPAEEQPGGKYDSMYVYRFYKNHYWAGTAFYDERLVRTTFFEDRIDFYFERLVAPNPDSVIKEIEWMLGYASINDEMQRFLLAKFVNRYINMKYMWDDKVFIYLFEKYFSQKDYPWLTEKGKKSIFDRAYSMMANIFGTQAAEIELPDSTGKMKNLFAVKDSFTVVVFWDPTCGHCKETLPRIDSIYRAKWKSLHVKIYAVAKESDGKKTDWLKFINDHKLENWVHVYYSKADNDARVNNNIPSYSQLYDVQSVPTLYLLDKDKRILAKKIPFEQIDEVLDLKLKGK
jgi:thiol-disulfide isomerase/thioredoxin